MKDGQNVVYMRVSNALKKTGVIGDKNGLMLEKYTIGTNDQLESVQKYVDLSSVTGIQPDNLYNESEIESKVWGLFCRIWDLVNMRFSSMKVR